MTLKISPGRWSKTTPNQRLCFSFTMWLLKLLKKSSGSMLSEGDTFTPFRRLLLGTGGPSCRRPNCARQRQDNQYANTYGTPYSSTRSEGTKPPNIHILSLSCRTGSGTTGSAGCQFSQPPRFLENFLVEMGVSVGFLLMVR